MLLELIDTAFPADQMFAGEVYGSIQGTEPFDETAPFVGQRWDALDCSFVDQHYGALGWFSVNAFCYYLPAFLKCSLEHPLWPRMTIVISSLVFTFTGCSAACRRIREAILQVLNSQQKQVLCEWFKEMKRMNLGFVDDDDFDLAISNLNPSSLERS
jgi:hypothetical protein